MRSVNSQRFSVISSFQLEARETVYSWLTRGQTGFRLSSLRGADHQEKWWRGDSVAARDLIYIYIFIVGRKNGADGGERNARRRRARLYGDWRWTGCKWQLDD